MSSSGRSAPVEESVFSASGVEQTANLRGEMMIDMYSRTLLRARDDILDALLAAKLSLLRNRARANRIGTQPLDGRVVLTRQDFDALRTLYGEISPEDMFDIVKDSAVRSGGLDDGYELQLNSRSWSSSDDGGTDYSVVIVDVLRE